MYWDTLPSLQCLSVYHVHGFTPKSMSALNSNELNAFLSFGGLPTEVCTKANSASDRQLVILSNGPSSHRRRPHRAEALPRIQRKMARCGGNRFPFRGDCPHNRRNLPSGEPALPVDVLLLGDLPRAPPRAYRRPRPDRRVELLGAGRGGVDDDPGAGGVRLRPRAEALLEPEQDL